MRADVERIGDETKKIAKMARKDTKTGQAPIGYSEAYQIGKNVQNMLNDVLYAFAKFDADTAQKVIAQDQEIDDMYKSASRAVLTYVMEDSRNVAKIIDIMWVLRSQHGRTATLLYHRRRCALPKIRCNKPQITKQTLPISHAFC